VKYIVSLVVVLSSFWMINSGYLKPMLLTFGVLSVVIVCGLTMRINSRDGEVFPIIFPSLRLPGYLIWMIGQVVAANIDVIKRVWGGRAAISPVIIETPSSQKTEVARVLYANSITMTPGTITLSVRGDILEVHALSREGAEQLQQGEMDRRVTALEGA
jgi:multicomponent Na+:H+ antiporter subunit E